MWWRRTSLVVGQDGGYTTLRQTCSYLVNSSWRFLVIGSSSCFFRWRLHFLCSSVIHNEQSLVQQKERKKKKRKQRRRVCTFSASISVQPTTAETNMASLPTSDCLFLCPKKTHLNTFSTNHGLPTRQLLHSMIIPVRCFSCGKVIGNKWDNYLSLLQADYTEGYVEIEESRSHYERPGKKISYWFLSTYPLVKRWMPLVLSVTAVDEWSWLMLIWSKSFFTTIVCILNSQLLLLPRQLTAFNHSISPWTQSWSWSTLNY